MHYLVIEDDEIILNILREIFDMLEPDSTFTYFKDGHQATRWLDAIAAGSVEELPDIAFIDIRMPGPQGYEIAERIRSIDAISNMGIVLMTAYELSESEYKEAMSRSQADRFISKPLPGVRGLNQVVEEIMAIRRKLEEEPESDK